MLSLAPTGVAQVGGTVFPRERGQPRLDDRETTSNGTASRDEHLHQAGLPASEEHHRRVLAVLGYPRRLARLFERQALRASPSEAPSDRQPSGTRALRLRECQPASSA